MDDKAKKAAELRQKMAEKLAKMQSRVFYPYTAPATAAPAAAAQQSAAMQSTAPAAPVAQTPAPPVVITAYTSRSGPKSAVDMIADEALARVLALKQQKTTAAPATPTQPAPAVVPAPVVAQKQVAPQAPAPSLFSAPAPIQAQAPLATGTSSKVSSRFVLDAQGNLIDVETGNIVNVPAKPVASTSINVKYIKEKYQRKLQLKKPVDIKKLKGFDPSMKIPAADRQKRALEFAEEGKFVEYAKKIREDKAKAYELYEYKQKEIEEKQRNRTRDTRLREWRSAVHLDLIGESHLRLGTFDEIPEVEWWDQKILAQESNYDAVRAVVNETDPLPIKEKLVANIYIEHPVPEEPAEYIRYIGSLPLYLTKRERRKYSRQRRIARELEKQQKIRLGLIPPPPPKANLANFMRVHLNSGLSDPTQLEKNIREYIEYRKYNHEMRNQERKLTPEQRWEKKQKKLADDESKELICAVFRIGDISHPYNRHIVNENAKTYKITGCSIMHERFNMIVAEGGPRSIRKFTHILCSRIDWNIPFDPTKDMPSQQQQPAAAATEVDGDDPMQEDGGDAQQDGDAGVASGDAVRPSGATLAFSRALRKREGNYCAMVWKGTISYRSFEGFRFHQFQADAYPRGVRRFLRNRGVPHLLDMCQYERNPDLHIPDAVKYVEYSVIYIILNTCGKLTEEQSIFLLFTPSLQRLMNASSLELFFHYLGLLRFKKCYDMLRRYTLSPAMTGMASPSSVTKEKFSLLYGSKDKNKDKEAPKDDDLLHCLKQFVSCEYMYYFANFVGTDKHDLQAMYSMLSSTLSSLSVIAPSEGNPSARNSPATPREGSSWTESTFMNSGSVVGATPLTQIMYGIAGSSSSYKAAEWSSLVTDNPDLHAWLPSKYMLYDARTFIYLRLEMIAFYKNLSKYKTPPKYEHENKYIKTFITKLSRVYHPFISTIKQNLMFELEALYAIFKCETLIGQYMFKESVFYFWTVKSLLRSWVKDYQATATAVSSLALSLPAELPGSKQLSSYSALTGATDQDKGDTSPKSGGTMTSVVAPSLPTAGPNLNSAQKLQQYRQVMQSPSGKQKSLLAPFFASSSERVAKGPTTPQQGRPGVPPANAFVDPYDIASATDDEDNSVLPDFAAYSVRTRFFFDRYRVNVNYLLDDYFTEQYQYYQLTAAYSASTYASGSSQSSYQNKQYYHYKYKSNRLGFLSAARSVIKAPSRDDLASDGAMVARSYSDSNAFACYTTQERHAAVSSTYMAPSTLTDLAGDKRSPSPPQRAKGYQSPYTSLAGVMTLRSGKDKRNPLTTCNLFRWLNMLFGFTVSKFTFFFHDVLQYIEGSKGPFYELCSTTVVDYLSWIRSFHAMANPESICLLYNTEGEPLKIEHPFGYSIKHMMDLKKRAAAEEEGTGEGKLTGLRSWPCVFLYPDTDRNTLMMTHWPNLLSLIMDPSISEQLDSELEPFYFTDSHYSYFISRFDSRMHLAVIFGADEKLKPRVHKLCVGFMTEMTKFLRMAKLYQFLTTTSNPVQGGG